MTIFAILGLAAIATATLESTLPAAANGAIEGEDRCEQGDDAGLLQVQSNKPCNEDGTNIVNGNECHLNALGLGCPLRSLKKGKTYKIFPGGKTKCINTSAPYWFTVYPGSRDKLLYFFQSGGACWNNFTYVAGNCRLQAPSSENTDTGLLNMTDPLNPYRDYTKVIVQYCSGDVHVGDTTHVWGLGAGEKVEMRGFTNADAVFQWTQRQFHKLSSLALLGCSAGTVGLQLWTERLLEGFKMRRWHSNGALLYADSYLGAVWPPTKEEFVKLANFLASVWEFCNKDLLSPEVYAMCKSGTLTVQDLWKIAMAKYAESSFNVILNKADSIQIQFENLLSHSRGNTGPLMTPQEFYKSANLMLQDFHNSSSSFGSFLVNADALEDHCWVNKPIVFTGTPLGASGEVGQPRMIDWMSSLPNFEGPASVCQGPRIPVTQEGPTPDSNVYCDANLPNQP